MQKYQHKNTVIDAKQGWNTNLVKQATASMSLDPQGTQKFNV